MPEPTPGEFLTLDELVAELRNRVASAVLIYTVDCKNEADSRTIHTVHLKCYKPEAIGLCELAKHRLLSGFMHNEDDE